MKTRDTSPVDEPAPTLPDEAELATLRGWYASRDVIAAMHAADAAADRYVVE